MLEDGMVMPNWLMQRAHLTPERIGLVYNEKEFTFLKLHEEATLKFLKLKNFGVEKGDHVAVLMKNSAEMVSLLHAIFYAGAQAVLLNSRLTEEELRWQLEDAEAKLAVCDASLIGKIEASNTSVISLDQLNQAEELAYTPEKEFNLKQTASIMYTSGTTGFPKGVQQTFGNHWWSASGSLLNLGLSENDKWLAAVPVFHISGLSILFRSVIYGISVVLFDKFDAKSINQTIMTKGITTISVVGTMLKEMIEEMGERKYPKTFRCMLLGGGPAAKSMLEECKEKKIPVFQTFGMTETSSQFTTLSPEYSISKLGSAGKPLFPNQIKILGENGEEKAANEAGEILVKGPNVTPGYWKREEATEKNIINGWFRTGDIGLLDEEGFLYVLDRRSDLIISGGENVYPAEIESVLSGHPSVKEAGVAGASHEKWGEVPHAFIVLSSNAEKQDLIDYCKEYLAPYKIPAYITFTSELPRNASRKLLRRTLKEWANEDQSR
ncbi:o-succinylbenzoate--CoA ligase [Metabacillus sp. RGM 3146]|uniref:o-succinylbenzoate--CoA ligase n=1 Tax=Metabacillus sp. RGM 3146 TaxID=3401092 RepID=UPI003B997E44